MDKEKFNHNPPTTITIINILVYFLHDLYLVMSYFNTKFGLYSVFSYINGFFQFNSIRQAFKRFIFKWWQSIPWYFLEWRHLALKLFAIINKIAMDTFSFYCWNVHKSLIDSAFITFTWIPRGRYSVKRSNILRVLIHTAKLPVKKAILIYII